METQVFDTKPLLRPHQLDEMRNQVKVAEAKLTNPRIEDKNEARKQLLRSRKTLEEQTPRPPVDAAEEGRMVAREAQLREDILNGMPSQEEMRKAPPGAVDKHMGWEKRNKQKILEWKNLQLRLKPGEREAANFERHRPVASTLSMDNAVIPGKQIYIPDNVGATVVFSDAELMQLMQIKPGLAGTVGSMTNEQRALVKDLLAAFTAPPAADAPAGDAPAAAQPAAATGKKSSGWTPEMRQAARDRMAKVRAAKLAKKVT